MASEDLLKALWRLGVGWGWGTIWWRKVGTQGKPHLFTNPQASWTGCLVTEDGTQRVTTSPLTISL